MSGGSLDYAYFKLEMVADELERLPPNDVALKSAGILRYMTTVLRDIEWYMSGDSGEQTVEQHRDTIDRLYNQL